MYAARLSRWAGRRATRRLINQIRLVNILSGDACSPLGLTEFERYLAFKEHSLENLQFIVWYHDYRARFFALEPEEQALSPPPVNIPLLSPPAPTYAGKSAPNSPNSPDWSFSPTTSASSTSWAQWSPITPIPYSPTALKSQPFRTETLQIVATFIRPNAKKELNLDVDVRDDLLRALEKTTHPDVFAPAYTQIYDLVDTSSVPIFVSTAAANINFPKQVYWYLIGITFTLISWTIAICTIYLIPDTPRSKRSIRLVSVPFAVLGSMQIYSAWRGYCSQVFGRSARQLHTWELVDPADAGITFDFDPTPVPLPSPPRPPRTVTEMAEVTNRRDVAPFLHLPSEPSLLTNPDEIEMTDLSVSSTRKLNGPRIDIAESSPRTGRAAYRRPKVYGPEQVVDDARVRAYHQGVLRDMLWVGFGWGLMWTAVVVGVPGRS